MLRTQASATGLAAILVLFLKRLPARQHRRSLAPKRMPGRCWTEQLPR